MRIEARAPARVDLAGGTVDIWPLYLFHPGAQTVNLAIRCYATCVIETRPDRQIVLSSKDQEIRETFEDLDDLARVTGKHITRTQILEIAKNVEIVVTRYERGIAYVRPWEEISEASESANR